VDPGEGTDLTDLRIPAEKTFRGKFLKNFGQIFIENYRFTLI
jgi:hypothetical protein